ncbi:MAG: hypothetical protein VX733_09060 [Candidatus Latescibacterota bacterium]|nr:hypothetical protein [Candidatus Latescibacterota bacterium]
MDYFRAKRFLDTLPDWETGVPPSGPLDHYLPRTRALLHRLGDPQTRYRSVIVGGSNGKGTVSSLLAQLLEGAGQRTGLYISPHLHSHRERAQVAGELLSKDEWARAVTDLYDVTRDFAREQLGDFSRYEALTALAALLFTRHRVETAVFEVGLGGRYDAANAWDHDVAVLTRVSLDHCAVLGNDLCSIVDEKLPITRSQKPLFTLADQAGDVQVRIAEICRERQVPLFETCAQGVHHNGEVSPYLTEPPSAQRPSTWRENARLALAVAHHVGPGLTPGAAAQVLAAHRWPGRYELASEKPLVILDGAHNPAAAGVLCQDLIAHGGRGWTFVVGTSSGHDYTGLLCALWPAARRFVLTAADHPRALDAEQLLRALPEGADGEVEDDWRNAIEVGLGHAADSGGLCVTGSLHLVARARERLGLPFEPEGLSEDVVWESLECVEIAGWRRGLKSERVSADGNVLRLQGRRRSALFYRNKHPFNDYVAARMAEDKGYQHEFFTDAGLPVPKTVQVFNPYADERFDRYKTHFSVEQMVAELDGRLGYPVVVKKHRSSMSQGVYLEHDAESMHQRLQSLFENAGSNDNLLLIQSFVEGAEYRAVASQSELLLVYEKVGEKDGMDLNPLHHHGGRAVRVEDPQVLVPVARLVQQIAGVIDLGLYAVDLIRGSDGFSVLELNPNPFCYYYNQSNGREDFVRIYEKLIKKYL